MSGLAIVSLALLAQVVIGVAAAIVGTRWVAARQGPRDHPGGGPRRGERPLPPYPSGDLDDGEQARRELSVADR